MNQKNKTRRIPVDVLKEFANRDRKVLQSEIVDHTRWNVSYEMVFEYEGKLYRSYYSVGATEYQDEGPYEYDGPEVECTEVVPVQKMVTVYEPIPLE